MVQQFMAPGLQVSAVESGPSRPIEGYRGYWLICPAYRPCQHLGLLLTEVTPLGWNVVCVNEYAYALPSGIQLHCSSNFRCCCLADSGP